MISSNLRRIRERIEEVSRRVGRDPAEITLVAVSKNFETDAVREAAAAGQHDFGENRAQELRDKYDDVGDDVRWHFIGHLQSNKAKYVARAASVVHSIDSIKIARALDKEYVKAERRAEALIEVKTSSEETKFGVEEEDELKRIVETVAGSERLTLVGLMTIAPYAEDPDVARRSFAELREIKERLDVEGATDLSMGMTHDFETAIEEGATILRIGTAIFGERTYR
jgi:PLP dependent protein